jgi:hypothetical protein
MSSGGSTNSALPSGVLADVVPTFMAHVRLPRGWRVAQSEPFAWLALGPGPAIGGFSPRVAMSLAPRIDDPQELVRSQVAGLFLSDETLRAIDEETFVTVAGDRACRVLTSRIVNGVGLTTDHWVVARGGGSVMLAGAAASAAWPMVQAQVRRALRAVVAVA